MATNEILQFAETDTGTNLLTQAEYLADAQRPIGNQTGVARSKLVNKALRQSSLIAAAVAQFIADNQTNNVVDTATPADIADWLEAAAKSVGAPSGTIIFVAANSAPNGYLKANGAGVSRTAYSALFAAIGTTFGAGDGSTTFNLPDLRGEFIRGFDDGRGVDSGRAFGSSQSDTGRSHKHISPVNDTASSLAIQNARGTGWPSGSAAIGVAGCNNISTSVVQLTTGEDSWLYTGSDVYVSGESRPRNIALLACIKY